MIVEPDFLDHWKTRLLVRLLGTELAPLYVIRLWAHCQARKTDRFTGWTPEILASVCRLEPTGNPSVTDRLTEAKTLWDAMAQTYLTVDGDTVIARGWADANASLLSAWRNGKLGGRPQKQAIFATEKPTGNPPVNQPVNPPVTDRVSDRVDREEKIDKTDKSVVRFKPPTLEECKALAVTNGMPETEGEKFFHYYESKGWKVGRDKMKSAPSAMFNWRARYDERNTGTNGGQGSRNLTPVEQRNSLIAGAAETIAQSHRTAQRERERDERGELPL